MARILIMEDNQANLDLMVYLLKAMRHEVLEAHDGEEGLELMRRVTVDLVVCDVHMPRLDGYGVAARLKAFPAWRKIPILAVTAMAMVGDRDKVLAAGFDGYLSKPIEPESFARDISHFLPGEPRAPESWAGPGAEQVPPPASYLAVNPRPDSGRTILVVDDVEANRRFAQSALEPFGYEVLMAGGAEDALRSARLKRPDIILSDTHMPKASGLDLVMALKADRMLKDIPVILISSSKSELPAHAAAIAHGAQAFVTRPIEPEDLLSTLERCLEEFARRRADLRENPSR